MKQKKRVLTFKKTKKIKDPDFIPGAAWEEPGLCVLFLYECAALRSEASPLTSSQALQLTGEGRHGGGYQIIFETSPISEG